ncbi:MAG: glycosyltransferase family 4 protein [candidate division Zixibacteria bacterium]|nr:glycosyltransferase family 4 protein [candidate division Zixibacteria bacterium]MCI0595005.1 glycosyltransferase family 4 protein [candidate division Zixibacteria bacterium]
MRILQSAALEGRSAGSEYALAYSRALQERGHAVSFLTVPKSRTHQRAKDLGLETVVGIDLSERKFAFLRNLSKLKDVVEKLRPEVVLAHWGPDHTAWGWALRKTKIPLVRVRSHSPLFPNRHFAARWLTKRTALFIVGNAVQQRQYIEELGVPEEKVVQIPFGIKAADYPSSSASSATGRAIRILQLGRFSPVKGHRFLFQALGELKSELRTPFRLTVVGFEAELRAADLHKWREESGLWDQIEILPNAPDVLGLIASCDFGVVASTGSEATARAALEFLATGKPVLASRVGILAEIVDEKCGWLFEPGNFESFSLAFKQALVSSSRYAEMGRVARAKVETDFDLEKLAERMESVLQKRIANG